MRLDDEFLCEDEPAGAGTVKRRPAYGGRTGDVGRSGELYGDVLFHGVGLEQLLFRGEDAELPWAAGSWQRYSSSL